jgi:Spy/CpxP family protein refolding chaperone
VVNLAGPAAVEELPKALALTDDQAKEYTAIRDSFVAATQTERDAARHRVEQLTGAVVGRDSVAAEYYRERLKELNRSLKEQESKFDERIKKLLTKNQQKEYRDWRRKQEDAARNPGKPEGGRFGRQ